MQTEQLGPARRSRVRWDDAGTKQGELWPTDVISGVREELGEEVKRSAQAQAQRSTARINLGVTTCGDAMTRFSHCCCNAEWRVDVSVVCAPRLQHSVT